MLEQKSAVEVSDVGTLFNTQHEYAYLQAWKHCSLNAGA